MITRQPRLIPITGELRIVPLPDDRCSLVEDLGDRTIIRGRYTTAYGAESARRRISGSRKATQRRRAK